MTSKIRTQKITAQEIINEEIYNEKVDFYPFDVLIIRNGERLKIKIIQVGN